ncbi:hypothetical protein ABI_08910 [Asticcacaulis biprosthecium C19]|uniref:Uncharacterized protein n=1 Tax=Asticcacaulis biprosthecium C19 TaxID=715226 RepID=F4QGC7_9CAUL|nr:hypothetical protein ABI_08910 [Asticcacaulis biprosthecium C19]
MKLGLGIPAPALRDGALAEIERRVASAVSLAMQSDPRTRLELAADVSALLGEDGDKAISVAMLNAYASEARTTHNISFGRALALFAATQRFDILNALINEIGVQIVTAEQLLTLELGDAQLKLSRLTKRARFLAQIAPEIGERS